MTSLFKKEVTFAGNIITQTRPLTRSDVVIKEYDTVHNDNTLRRGNLVELKQEHIDDLISICGIKLSTNGRFTLLKEPFKGIIHCNNTQQPTQYPAFAECVVSYRGIRTTEARQARYEAESLNLSIEADEREEELIDSAIANIASDIEHALYTYSRVTKQNIKKRVVDLNISKEERLKLLTEEESKAHAEAIEEKKRIESMLNMFKAQLDSIDNDIYSIERGAVTRDTLQKVGDEGASYIATLSEES